MNALADHYRCLVAYPIQPTSANSSKCWNWFNLRDQLRDSGEPSLIVGIVHQIADDYAIDSRRVYVAGLSAGGAAASVLGARYPDVFAAVGVHSGLACGAAHGALSAMVAMQGRAPADILAAFQGRPLEPRSEMPTIVFHGDRDTTVNL